MTYIGRSIGSELAIQCLRLHLVHGVGPRRFQLLLEHFGNLENILKANQSELKQVRLIGEKTSQAILACRDDTFVDQELARLEQLGGRLLCRWDEQYPRLMKELPDAPVCLYVLGELRSHDDCSLAIVGSRRCSHYGQEQAYRFGADLGRVGMTVVSGLARGVDAQAHRGALDCRGRTAAILGCGLSHLESHENKELADRIIHSGGAVISELPIIQPPAPENFPARNRLIAGMSLGTLVVEAAGQSGALITAQLTQEYNRELFALPGPIDRPSAVGSNRLIQRQQAKLVMTLADILQELGHAGQSIAQNYQDQAETLLASVQSKLNTQEQLIFQSLSAEGVELEHISVMTKLPPEQISSNLTLLQLKGIVEQLPGNKFARIGK